MANELQILPNPDNVPGAVTSGYQRQNTNLFVVQTGLDTTEPFDNGSGVITIPAGGIIEVNGVMFKITSLITLNKSDTSRAYWIAITDNGNGFASAALVERPGAWNPAKQGCYTSDNKRTLNWVSLGTINSTSGLTSAFSQNVKGKWTIRPQKGWYYAELQSGKGGVDGANGANGNPGSDSGSAGSGATGAGTGGAVTTSSPKKTAARIFFYNGVSDITVKVGGDGYNGGNGGNGASGGSGSSSQGGGGGGGKGGGGGSGAGEASSLVTDNTAIDTGEQPGGNGGNGGSGGSGGGFGSPGPGGSGGGGGGVINGTGGGLSGGGNSYGQTGGGGQLAGGNGASGDSPLHTGYGGNAGKGARDGYNGVGGTLTTGHGNAGKGGGGGGGGAMGADGIMRPDGEAYAGYCRIYKI